MSGDVTLALSELRSLMTKAARGAGLGWGMAEEAGWATDWLARRGMPAADWATTWLAASIEGADGPVVLGVTLADEMAGGHAALARRLPDGISAPGYLLPFLHRIAEARGPVAIWSPLGRVVTVDAKGQVAFGPGWQPRSEGWQLCSAPAAEGAAARPVVSASVLDCLEGLALRTTVPQSETSRRDAGSLTGDND